jgi:hypothetical protein
MIDCHFMISELVEGEGEGGGGEPACYSRPQFPIGNRYNHSNTKLCIKVYIDHCRRPAYKRCASNLSLGWTNYISLYTRACREENAFCFYYTYTFIFIFIIFTFLFIFLFVLLYRGAFLYPTPVLCGRLAWQIEQILLVNPNT